LDNVEEKNLITLLSIFISANNGLSESFQLRKPSLGVWMIYIL
jgi:hypothetical protein